MRARQFNKNKDFNYKKPFDVYEVVDEPLIAFKKVRTVGCDERTWYVMKIEIPIGARIVVPYFGETCISNAKLRTDMFKVLAVRKLTSRYVNEYVGGWCDKPGRIFRGPFYFGRYSVGKTYTSELYESLADTCVEGLHFFLSSNKAKEY